jgi:hypothetical protein
MWFRVLKLDLSRAVTRRKILGVLYRISWPFLKGGQGMLWAES